MIHSNSEIKDLLKKCTSRKRELNEWELNFFNKMKGLIKSEEKLSSKQKHKLGQILDKLK